MKRGPSHARRMDARVIQRGRAAVMHLAAVIARADGRPVADAEHLAACILAAGYRWKRPPREQAS